MELKIKMEDVDWIYLAQDWGKWLPSVNAVLNLRVP
jgi:hypothetical protein